MDVGGSSVKYALIGPDRSLTEHGKVPTPHDDRAAYLDALAGIYAQFRGRVEGIAMSVPGIIDSEGGVCKTTGALGLGEDFPLVQELEARCGVPVTIANDAKAAATAEAAWGSLAGCSSGIVIVLGTGIGGALILDGKVLAGRQRGGPGRRQRRGRLWLDQRRGPGRLHGAGQLHPHPGGDDPQPPADL